MAVVHSREKPSPRRKRPCGHPHLPRPCSCDTTPFMPENDPLEPLRKQIDHLTPRSSSCSTPAPVVVEVGKIKQPAAAPIYAPDREKAVLEKCGSSTRGPLPDRCLEAVYRELMSGSFALEKPLRIGFLGPAGSFSHAASVRKFGSSVEYVPLADIPGVFEEVVRGHIDYGLVPVENSLHGGIVDTLDAFLQQLGQESAPRCGSPSITTCWPAAPWEKVKTIYSKPEVFSQCRKWLAAVAKDRDVQPAASTSKAAELAAQRAGVAAIGSALAGELYGLQVLFENIEDDPDNVTRFFVIGREGARAHRRRQDRHHVHHRPQARRPGRGAGRFPGKRHQPDRHRKTAQQEGELGILFLHRRPGPRRRPKHEKRHRPGPAALSAIDRAGQLSAGDGSAVRKFEEIQN